jgi:hypothetical protein
MSNKHGLTARVVKKQAAARKAAKGKKRAIAVYIGNENAQVRKNTSFKCRVRYYENKNNFPKKKLPTKDVRSLQDMGIIDERGFFVKGKKKNWITRSMIDTRGLDYYGMPRAR